MINKRTTFLLIISLFVLSNAQVIGMMAPPKAPHSKPVTFSMITQLISNYFIKSEQEVRSKIKDAVKALTDEIDTLRKANKIQEEIGLTNPSGLQKVANNINNLWDRLTYLYVSNTFEEFFNKYGPDIEKGYPDSSKITTKEEAAEKEKLENEKENKKIEELNNENKELRLDSIIKKLKLQVHPDKNLHNNGIFTELSKAFTIDRRKTQLTSPGMINTLDTLASFIATKQEEMITTFYHNEIVNRTNQAIEIRKTQLKTDCELMILNHKMAQFFKGRMGYV